MMTRMDNLERSMNELKDATLSDKFWSLTEQKIPSGGSTQVTSATLVAGAAVHGHLCAAALGAE